jgi:ATP-binding cassette subfamily D (ALD) protein 3
VTNHSINAQITNNALKLNISALKLAIRERLTKYAHECYFKNITFYKVSNLDNRVHNADQLLTQDIDKFSDTMTHLYSDTLKPIVDIALFAMKLSEAIGKQGPVVILGYFLTTATLLRTISPPFGKCLSLNSSLKLTLQTRRKSRS